MICSLRFYFKQISEPFDVQKALEVLDHLSQTLSLPYSRYKCTMFFDDDKGTGNVSEFPAGETGRSKLLNTMGNLQISKNRDKLACIFLAGIAGGAKEEACSPRCEFFLTPGKMASHISIDIPFDCQTPVCIANGMCRSSSIFHLVG